MYLYQYNQRTVKLVILGLAHPRKGAPKKRLVQPRSLGCHHLPHGLQLLRPQGQLPLTVLLCRGGQHFGQHLAARGHLSLCFLDQGIHEQHDL